MNKKVAFWGLLLIAMMIMISGAFFSVYSFLTHVSFKVMGSDFPGFIFGLVAVFLGVRYTMSLNRLKKKIDDSNAKFSWSNFKKSNSI